MRWGAIGRPGPTPRTERWLDRWFRRLNRWTIERLGSQYYGATRAECLERVSARCPGIISTGDDRRPVRELVELAELLSS